jgi:hypothetical protein
LESMRPGQLIGTEKRSVPPKVASGLGYHARGYREIEEIKL